MWSKITLDMVSLGLIHSMQLWEKKKGNCSYAIVKQKRYRIKYFELINVINKNKN